MCLPTRLHVRMMDAACSQQQQQLRDQQIKPPTLFCLQIARAPPARRLARPLRARDAQTRPCAQQRPRDLTPVCASSSSTASLLAWSHCVRSTGPCATAPCFRPQPMHAATFSGPHARHTACCSADLAAIAERMSKVKNKLLVLSGKGGVGKSTFATQLAFALAAQGKEVRRNPPPQAGRQGLGRCCLTISGRTAVHGVGDDRPVTCGVLSTACGVCVCVHRLGCWTLTSAAPLPPS
jgi:hypothetical protein